jgi:hypothetical protein
MYNKKRDEVLASSLFLLKNKRLALSDKASPEQHTA